MTLERMKLSAQTVRENIAILEQVEDVEDAGYYLQLEHEKFVLECIEKQIPKKPIKLGLNPLKLICSVSYVCPHCNKHISITPYCSTCGQALDWSDTE